MLTTRKRDFVFDAKALAGRRPGRPDSYRPDNTLLPGFDLIEHREIGVRLGPARHDLPSVRDEIEALLLPLKFQCQLATETSPGDKVWFNAADAINLEEFAAFIRENALSFFHI
jgi:hypothetical protein